MSKFKYFQKITFSFEFYQKVFKFECTWTMVAAHIYVTKYNKRYILSTFEENETFALSNRIYNKLSNDTKIIEIEVILLKTQLLQSVYFLLFSLYFAHYFVHYLRINLADKMSLFVVLGHILPVPSQSYCTISQAPGIQIQTDRTVQQNAWF